ncbi:MAG: hypothetical protein AAB971_00030, partial [Patescibacteria group bacterium]
RLPSAAAVNRRIAGSETGDYFDVPTVRLTLEEEDLTGGPYSVGRKGRHEYVAMMELDEKTGALKPRGNFTEADIKMVETLLDGLEELRALSASPAEQTVQILPNLSSDLGSIIDPNE